MNKTVWVPLLLVACAAAAGCTSKANDPAADLPDPSKDRGGADGILDGNATERPLLATFEVTPLNGTAPLNVTFRLEAINASPAVAATLEFGDGNRTGVPTLPANVTHTYTQAGNHTAVLELVDGNRTVRLTALVVVLDGALGLPAGMPLGTLPFSAEGTILAGVYGLSGTDPACGNGANASHDFEWVVPATAADGTPQAVSRFQLAMEGGDTNVDSDLYLYAPDGTEVGSSAGLTSAEAFEREGTYAPGTYVVKVVGCAAVNGAFTVTGEAALVSA